MKGIICCAILICVLMQVRGDCGHGDESLTVGEHFINCTKVVCNEDGTTFGVTCPAWQCAEGKQIGYRELDITKSYPDCCAGPICEDD